MSQLLLFPNLIGEHKNHELYLPASVDRAVAEIDGLIAESEKEGRRFLSRFTTKKTTHLVPIALLNEHSKDEDVDFFLEPMAKGESWGLISDAGLPCIADPGYRLVKRARERGIEVKAFSGPSSVFLAIMLSGLPSQRFYFQGYLAKDPDTRSKEIKKLEKQSKEEESLQVFIETPYRNQHTLENLLKVLDEKTWLSVAWELTSPTQGVETARVSTWKKRTLPNLEKKNAIFLISVS